MTQNAKPRGATPLYGVSALIPLCGKRGHGGPLNPLLTLTPPLSQAAEMARKPRIEYAGTVYHVMNRGDQREPVFTDKSGVGACARRSKSANNGFRGLISGNPIHHIQAGDATKLALVVGDKRKTCRKRVGSNQGVERADSGSLRIQVGANPAIHRRRQVAVR